MPETQDELDAVIDVLIEGRDAHVDIVNQYEAFGVAESVLAVDREFIAALSQAIDYLTTK